MIKVATNGMVDKATLVFLDTAALLFFAPASNAVAVRLMTRVHNFLSGFAETFPDFPENSPKFPAAIVSSITVIDFFTAHLAFLPNQRFSTYFQSSSIFIVQE